METYHYNTSEVLSMTETTSSQTNADNTPASPGFGPAGSVTPSLPETGTDNTPATPGFGPAGSVTPSVPSRPSQAERPSQPTAPTPPIFTPGNGLCINCGNENTSSSNNTGALWTWGTLAPFFSTSSEIAHLRFYNAAAIREPLDIYLNGRPVVSELDYMNYTRFLHIIPGLYRLTIYRTTNPGMPIIDTNIRINSGSSTTLVILGSANNYSVQMIS